MYYENFEKLCKLNNVTAGKVSKATGISTATLSSWKTGKYTPKPDKLTLIADYFGVTLNYLMTGKEERKLTTEDAKEIALIVNDKEMYEVYKLLYELKQLNGDLSKAKEYLEFLISKEKNS